MLYHVYCHCYIKLHISSGECFYFGFILYICRSFRILENSSPTEFEDKTNSTNRQ
jgi:hypothetical protein